MPMYDSDLVALQAGQPPHSAQWLSDLTLGRAVWLDTFKQHYLYNYIASGGSKVKMLVGREGTGKTHLLRCVEVDAVALGYAVVYLSARDISHRLNDLPNLYRAICKKIDKERMIKGLCRTMAMRLGYDHTRYHEDGALLPLLVADGFQRYDAEREIRTTVAKTLRQVDFGASFVTLAYTMIRDGLIAGEQSPGCFRSQLKWLAGEKLTKQEQQETGLLEKLNKQTARYWLNSLVKLLKLAGMTGLVVEIDELEVMTERSPETGRFLYTPSAIKDTCEMFRQMIDDVDLLNHFLLLVSGRRQIIDDERRGFKSYEALWMRLQTGLVSSDKFNPYADIVDVDGHYATLSADFPKRLSAHLSSVFQQHGFERCDEGNVPDVTRSSSLRQTVMENALQMECKEVAGEHGTV